MHTHELQSRHMKRKTLPKKTQVTASKYNGIWEEMTDRIEEQKTNLMSLALLFHFLYAQHVSGINMSIIKSLRLFC